MNPQQGLIAYFQYVIPAAELGRVFTGPRGDGERGVLGPDEVRFVVTRPMLLALCDAVESGDMAPGILVAIGEELLLGEALTFDLEHQGLLAEICRGWSAPGIANGPTRVGVAKAAERLRSAQPAQGERPPLGKLGRAQADYQGGVIGPPPDADRAAIVNARIAMYGGWLLLMMVMVTMPLVVDEYVSEQVFRYFTRALPPALFFAWFRADAKVEGFQPSRPLDLGVLFWPIGVPYYLLKVKGFWRGLESFIKFLGFLSLACAMLYVLHHFYDWRLPSAT